MPVTQESAVSYESAVAELAPAEAATFTVTFDRCASAPVPTLADLSCTVLSCAQGGGGVSGCTCVVSLP